jgi:hypothetical protein
MTLLWQSNLPAQPVNRKVNNMKNYSINLNQKNAKMPTDKSPSLKIEKKKPYVMPKVSNTGRGLGKY